MQSFSEDFLKKLAQEYDLSPDQGEALVKRFSNVNKNEQEVAEKLNISPNALRTRMTEVYRKFSIKGKGPGKFRRLHDFLLNNSQKSNSSGIPDVQKKDLDINIVVQEVRKKVTPYIKERCGTMRVLDMTQPIGLSNIYTDVNILEKITGRTP